MKKFIVTLTVPDVSDGIQREGEVTVLHPNGVVFQRGPINKSYTQIMREDGEKYVAWVLKNWFPVFADWGRDGGNAIVGLMFDSRDHDDDLRGCVRVFSAEITPHERKN